MCVSWFTDIYIYIYTVYIDRDGWTRSHIKDLVCEIQSEPIVVGATTGVHNLCCSNPQRAPLLDTCGAAQQILFGVGQRIPRTRLDETSL